ncbi:hypothetical protein [Clostridium sp.]|uniref:hypothetical protein n=1 Tax=Clostridium sp. TaxID=1506 RepID=UPI003D6CB7DC
MHKNIITTVSIIGIFIVLTGCNSVKNKENEEKAIINQTTQEKVIEVKNSEIPKFEEMYKETTEIDIYSGPEGMDKAIKIKDDKMVSKGRLVLF